MISIKVSTAKVCFFLNAAGLGDTRVIMGWNSADTLTSATEISLARDRFSAIVQQIAL